MFFAEKQQETTLRNNKSHLIKWLGAIRQHFGGLGFQNIAYRPRIHGTMNVMGNNMRIVISSLSANPLLFRLPFGRVAVYIVRQIKTDKYLRLETSR